MPKSSEDLALGEANARLDLGLVARLARTGRQDAEAIMRRHHAVAAIDLGVVERRLMDHDLEADRICDYRPMLLRDNSKPTHEAVRSWVRGFWKAMALAPEAWRALAEGERSRTLIAPFVGFFELGDHEFELGDHEPFEARDDIEAVLDEDAAAIPQTILVLRMLAQMRHRSAELRIPIEPGQVFRGEAGHRSDLMSATIPK